MSKFIRISADADPELRYTSNIYIGTKKEKIGLFDKKRMLMKIFNLQYIFFVYLSIQLFHDFYGKYRYLAVLVFCKLQVPIEISVAIGQKSSIVISLNFGIG